MATQKFRKAYDEPRKVSVSFEGDSGLTIQEQKRECDVNYIVEKFQRTGLITHVNERTPMFEEFKEFDFHKTQNDVAYIQQQFDQLPANVRAQFDHDPAKYLDYFSTIEGRKDALDDGIVNQSGADKTAKTDADVDGAPRTTSPNEGKKE